MPIIAQCPYCLEGSVRAPDRAIGLSATCPKCRSSFTIAAASETYASSSSTTTKTLAAKAETVTIPTTSVAELPAPVDVAPLPAPTKVDEPTMPWSLTAIALAGIGLIATQFPYGRFVALGCAGFGLLFGSIAWLLADRKRTATHVAPAVSGFVILLVVALPSWLGFSSWKTLDLPDDTKTVKALSSDGSTPIPVEWVDIQKASWLYDDIQVSAPLVAINALEVTGLKGQKSRTKEKYLQIRVLVKNVGVARKLEFVGWKPDATPDAPRPKVTDPQGNVLAIKVFEAPWEAGDRPQPAGLFPGKSAEQLFLFQPPAKPVEYLRFELPGVAFGETESVKLQIPWASITLR